MQWLVPSKSIADKVNAGCDRKIRYTHSASQFAVYGAVWLRTSQHAHAEPCSPVKAITMSTSATELDRGAMEGGGLV